jgi:hypothetical protein
VRFSNTDVWMADCLVKGNVIGEGSLAALEGVNGANLEMVNCRVEANVRGGLRHHAGGSDWVIIEGCEFLEHPEQRGIGVSQVANLEVSNTRFARNAVGDGPAAGGGMSVIQCGGSIEFCVFERDSAQESAGALYVSDSDMRVENNTFYACHGGRPSSVLLGAGFSGTFARNVVARSTGEEALRSIEPLGQDSGCNVFWDNEGGDIYGDWNPGLPDIFADPEFCDPEAGGFTVHPTSPCLAKNSGGCGNIGAFGVGCGTVSIESRSWGRVKSLYR